MNHENGRYPYRMKTSTCLFGILLFAGGSYFGFQESFYGDRGLIINHLIHLDAGQARVFWACLSVLSAGFVVAALFALYLNVTTQRAIVLRPRAITLPRRALSTAEVTIPYRDIVQLKLRRGGNQLYFTICTDREKVTVGHGCLPSRDSFLELYQEIAARTQRAQSAGAASF